MSISISRAHTKSLTLLAGTAVAALVIGGAGVGAQAADPVPLQQQASVPENSAPASSLPLGRDDVVEVQNQLIALGFDPGALAIESRVRTGRSGIRLIGRLPLRK